MHLDIVLHAVESTLVGKTKVSNANDNIEQFYVHIYFAVYDKPVITINYCNNIVNSVIFLKRQIEYFKTRFSKRWNNDVYFTATIMGKFKNKWTACKWLLYTHAPLDNKYELKKVSKKFIKQFKLEYNGNV